MEYSHIPVSNWYWTVNLDTRRHLAVSFSVSLGLIHFNNLLQRGPLLLTSAGAISKIALMIKTNRCLRGYSMLKRTQNNKTAGRRSTGAEGEIRTLDQGLMSPLLYH
jgi:hypothetical protein